MGLTKFRVVTLCSAMLLIVSLFLMYSQVGVKQMGVPFPNFLNNVKQTPGPVDQHTDNTTLNIHTEGPNPETNENLVQRKRLQKIKEMCNKTDVYKTAAYIPFTVVFRSNLHNLTYCKVPKSGSTVWSRLFMALHYGSEVHFGSTIPSAHSRVVMATFSFPLKQAIKNRNRMILVSRDPYSRLYSGFIDKIYLGKFPNLPYTNRRNRFNNTKCNIDITFDEFLQYVINRVKTGEVLNRHWAPIFSLCSPCDVNVYRLVKQETFSEDVEFILKELKVDGVEYKTIVTDGLTKPEIHGIYESNKARIQRYKCLKQAEVARRLWKSLQIRGMLDEALEFPKMKLANDIQCANQTYVSQIIMESMYKHPLTRMKSTHQRRRALVHAYKSVSKASIDGIKDVYKQDFALFGYDTEPPTKEFTKGDN